MKKESISAFAYNMGKEIEIFINNRNSNLHNRNVDLEARILNWYRAYPNEFNKEDFAEYFGIGETRTGIVNK